MQVASRQDSARARRLVLALGALALGACGSSSNSKPAAKYRLEGSLTQVMDLGYDEVRISATADDVALLFVRQHPLEDITADGGMTGMAGMSEDYPFKVTLALRGQEVPIGVNVDLTEEDGNMNQRGLCSRYVLNDPRRSFPRTIRGELFLDRPIEPDSHVGGNFHVTFENGIEPASGRTVFGNFDAKVVQ